MVLTYKDLIERQGWSLEQKIDHTVGSIEQFITKTNGKVFVSFSGGKDSTVLLDICRRFIDKNMLAVFCNTGNEYSEIRKFVKTFENVTVITPDIHIKKIIEKYGFPLISKEMARYIYQEKHTKSPHMLNLRLNGNEKGYGKISQKWKFLIDSPFEISERCCDFLKKKPFEKFGKETGLYPIIGTMVVESRLRFFQWLQRGCNSFDGKISSFPLSIWLEKDIWEYIRKFNISYCSLYDDSPGLKGLERTGCMVCGFGCMNKNDNRFEELKKREPKLFDYFMKLENNGIMYKQALEYCGLKL